jgi:hypothetical protein
MSQFDWPIPKKVEIWRLPKIKDSMEKWNASLSSQLYN